MNRSVTLFCSFLPFTFIAGAVLPISSFLPLSLIWTFSGRRWFAVASSLFLASKVSDLQPVYMFLIQSLKTVGIAPGLVLPIAVVTFAVVLSSFVLEAWLVKRWVRQRVSKVAPHLLTFR